MNINKEEINQICIEQFTLSLDNRYKEICNNNSFIFNLLYIIDDKNVTNSTIKHVLNEYKKYYKFTLLNYKNRVSNEDELHNIYINKAEQLEKEINKLIIDLSN